ncbi:metalloprotease 1 like protein [Zymoseptoria brevis]|uniref:Metalloprotease 1 like protein n=1 Tax=Zymoseptoria brevis TaxID=1047168 RepID=A0A0F4GG72_9PEZI|nr:metalloprotease 1 like protein [Zymoseptoria brevis]
MNRAFAPSFTFTLISADLTTNDIWATHDDDDFELEYKSLLKKGHNYGELDLYFLSDLGRATQSTLLGTCYMPGDSPSEEEVILDGCTILAGTMPGGETERYNLGATAIHETGHWLGLYHTFQGDSCDGPGDYVSDTPKQRVATDGCPAHQDTCSGDPGLDATYNYMDYSDDRCLSDFTPLQRVRMLHSYGAMRWRK